MMILIVMACFASGYLLGSIFGYKDGYKSCFKYIVENKTYTDFKIAELRKLL